MRNLIKILLKLTINSEHTNSVSNFFMASHKLPLPTSDFSQWSTASRSSGSLCIIRDDEIKKVKNETKNSPEGDNSPEPITTFGYTRRQICTVALFAISNLIEGNVVSIQAPFYPKEAEEKGATPSEYGFVFGVYYLTMMVCSPISGFLLSKISPKTMFSAGIFITGSSSILFGLLDFVPDRITFIVLSFIIRMIQAMGQAANVTASFTIITMEFPESVSTTFATLETCWGLGMIIGPTTGGILYTLGGFSLPFLVTGSLVTFMSLLAQILLTHQPPQKSETQGFGIVSLIKIPPVALAGFSVAVSACSIGFLNATLEPHLRDKFKLTPIYTGLMFIIDGSMYALSAPIWGRLCGKWCSQPKYVTLMGCTLTFCGFLFIGPAPFLPFDSILWVSALGLAIHGLGVGAAFVSSFLQGMQDAVANGFPDSVATYGLVSGLWVSALALGSFIGPCIGGILLDHFGFRLGSLFVMATQIVMGGATITFIYQARRKFYAKNLANETDPLLTNKKVSEAQLSIESSGSGKKKQSDYGST